jgi:DNA-directed RNA polymerase subunit RPC12/RpoP
MPEHQDKDRPPWRWNRPACPRCGSRRFIPIVYGDGPPDLMADVIRTAKKGLAKVVRRSARPGDPQFACARCGTPLEAGPKW